MLTMAFHYCDKMPDLNQLKGGKILAHSFGAFNM